MSSRPRRFFVPFVLSALLALSACGAPAGSFTVYADNGFVRHTEYGNGFQASTAFDREQDPLAGKLFGPHFALSMSGYSVVESLGAEEARAYGFQAGPVRLAEGTELFVAQFSTAEGEEKIERTKESILAHAVLSVDGEPTDLAHPPVDGEMIVAVVPAGAEVLLSVVDEERTQTLNMRDGSRPEQIDAYYSGALVTEDPDDYEGKGKATGVPDGNYESVQRTLNISMTVGQATRSPWLEDHGWADDGKVWLSVPIVDIKTDCVYGFDPDSHQPMMYWEFKQDDVFSLDPDEGKTVKAADNPKFKANEDSEVASASYQYVMFSPRSVDLVFQISDKATSAKLKIAPTGKLKAIWSNVTGSGRWDDKPDSKKIKFEF